MKRLDLINKLFNATDFKTYLEIGCYKGRTFFNVDAPIKIAVDPYFHRSFYIQLTKQFFTKYYNRKIYFIKKTSNLFFQKHIPLLNKLGSIDIVLIDGLHTFKASLQDVFNTLNYINPQGIIILHDCNPPNAGAAMPTLNFPSKEEQMACSDWSGAWCGDVWKTIVYLRRFHQEYLDVKVINTDSGLGIVRLKPNKKRTAFKIDSLKYNSINELTFKDLIEDKKGYLDLDTVENFKSELKQNFLKIAY